MSIYAWEKDLWIDLIIKLLMISQIKFISFLSSVISVFIWNGCIMISLLFVNIDIHSDIEEIILILVSIPQFDELSLKNVSAFDKQKQSYWGYFP